MNDATLKREVSMSVVRSAQSLKEVLEHSKNDGSSDPLKITSFQLRTEQKTMIDELARRNGESQATIIRAIVDEWVELKLSGL